MWVAHIFEFSKTQGLLCNGATNDILFCRRQAIGEEGGEFHCQVSCAPEGLGAQGFVKKGDSHALVLFSNLDVDGPYNLAPGLCKGAGIGGCSRKGGSLGGFVAIPDVLELESKGDGGPSGLRRCTRVSKNSVRQQRSMCSCE